MRSIFLKSGRQGCGDWGFWCFYLSCPSPVRRLQTRIHDASSSSCWACHLDACLQLSGSAINVSKNLAKGHDKTYSFNGSKSSELALKVLLCGIVTQPSNDKRLESIATDVLVFLRFVYRQQTRQQMCTIWNSMPRDWTSEDKDNENMWGRPHTTLVLHSEASPVPASSPTSCDLASAASFR